MPTRRDFNLGLASAAFGGLALAGCSRIREIPHLVSRIPDYRTRTMDRFAGYGALVDDPAGLFDLPPGFEYRIISRFGDPLGGRAYVPDKADGMGAFRLDDRRMILVRNHEVSAGSFAKGPFPHGAPEGPKHAYRPREGGPVQPGGTTTIVYDYVSQRVEEEYVSLVGTVRNCAGGPTPWGSWLTCEEEKGEGPDHGWVFEVPALTRAEFDREARRPEPICDMGRFRHEAAAVDPQTCIVYLTEDDAESLFYRFIPKRPGYLHEGGRLEALGFAGVSESVDTSNWDSPRWPERQPRDVRWIPLDGTANSNDGLRRWAHERGAARFAYGEGIYFGDGELYFTCTSGGRIKSGQIMRYVPSPGDGRLEIFLESTDPERINYADNIVVAPNGHLVFCEDPYVGGESNYLLRQLAGGLGTRSVAYVRGITPLGQVYDIARLNAWTELAGACFAPDGKTMFVNIMSPAKTLAVTGPWEPPPPGWSPPPTWSPA
jgi:secreted PhoX family phosphatase